MNKLILLLLFIPLVSLNVYSQSHNEVFNNLIDKNFILYKVDSQIFNDEYYRLKKLLLEAKLQIDKLKNVYAKEIELSKKEIENDPSRVATYFTLISEILDEEGVIVNEMNSLGYKKEDLLRYDELKIKRENLYKECIPILENILNISPTNIQALNILKNIYLILEDNEGFLKTKKIAEDREKELNKMKQDIEAYEKATFQDVQQREIELINPVIELLNPIISKIQNQQKLSKKYLTEFPNGEYYSLVFNYYNLIEKELLEIDSNLNSLQDSKGNSYLGYVNKQVNFRQGPGTDYKIIKSLIPGTQLFINSLNTSNNYYSVIDIYSNMEGYVHKSYVNVGEKVEKNDGGLFVPTEKTNTSLSKIEVYNNTSLTLTLKMGNMTYSFFPQQKKEINVNPGNYNYRVSAPGVIPYIGKEIINSGYNYSWSFRIVTR